MVPHCSSDGFGGVPLVPPCSFVSVMYVTWLHVSNLGVVFIVDAVFIVEAMLIFL